MSITTLEPMREALASKRAKLAAVQKTAADASRELGALRGEIAQIESTLLRGKPVEIVISEHALLRYAERVMGFDRSDVAKLVLEKVTPQWLRLGDGKFPVSPGYHAVVKNRTVVTIEPA